MKKTHMTNVGQMLVGKLQRKKKNPRKMDLKEWRKRSEGLGRRRLCLCPLANSKGPASLSAAMN